MSTDADTKVASTVLLPPKVKFYVADIQITSADQTTLETGTHGIVTLRNQITLPDIPGATNLWLTISKDIPSNP